MELAHIMSGNAPKFVELQIAATVGTVGVPLTIPAANGTGVVLATATSAANMVGCNIDTATYQAAQNSDGSDQAAAVTVIYNPDAVWRARLSGGATSGTALTAQTVSTATTDGLDVTTGFDYNTTDVDEGVIWGLAGVNAGIVRKITSTGVTAATVIVAFPKDHPVGDTFLHAPFFPFQSPTVTLTSAFDQVDCSVATSTSAAELVPINGFADGNFAGASDSYIHLVAGDHALSNRPT